MQDSLHPLPHADLAESKRACADDPLLLTAMDERIRIRLFYLGAQGLQHALVTGKLNIAAEQNVRRPQNGIEPIHAQQGKAERLPDVVAPRDMRTLMRDHIRNVLLADRRRQIDARAENAEDKRRRNVVADADAVLALDRHAHTAMHTHIADRGIQQHCRHAEDPNDRRGRHDRLHRRHAPRARGRQRLGEHGIDQCVQGIDTRVDRRRRGIHDILRYRLDARNQAQHALDRDRTEQPNAHECPQSANDGSRRPFQQKPHQSDREHKPACGDAHIEKF